MAKIKLTKPGEEGQPNSGGEGANGSAGAVTTPTEGANDNTDSDEGAANAAVRTATVTMRGRAPVEVEYPADAKDPFTAAVNAFKESQGIWSLPEQPEVQQHE